MERMVDCRLLVWVSTVGIVQLNPITFANSVLDSASKNNITSGGLNN